MDFSKHRVQVPEHVMMREVGGEAVILNIESEQYFGLDEVGTRMWEVLVTADSISTALETLLEEYDVDAEQLKQDLFEFINKLVSEKLLQINAS
jgi:Coenzyme PQQ synthesis protein D (PqqD)